MRTLIIGPSPDRSKGGMSTVITELRDDKDFAENCNPDIYESYIDGNLIVRLLFSLYSYIRFWLTKRSYDLYHIHMASRGSTFRKGLYVKSAKKWGKKVILHVHGSQYMEFYDSLSEKSKQRVIKIFSTADMVIALSDKWKERFETTFGLKNCVVLENGINSDKLCDGITDLSLNQNSFLVLGRLGKRKGTYDLVEATEIAVKQIPDIKVIIAGDGEIEQVTDLVRSKKLEKNVIIPGWVDTNGKIELLKQVSTVVLPSYNEGLPMSILEGMACGKAIISTKVDAIPEVVKEENGILIDAGDIQALADALIKCASDLDLIKKFYENNIFKIKNEYSMKIMHEKLLSYYRDVMERR